MLYLSSAKITNRLQVSHYCESGGEGLRAWKEHRIQQEITDSANVEKCKCVEILAGGYGSEPWEQ